MSKFRRLMRHPTVMNIAIAVLVVLVETLASKLDE